jgi:chloride channel 3/4/5
MGEEADEHTSLLGAIDGPGRTYTTRSTPATPGLRTLSRQQSVTGSVRMSKNHSRTNSGRVRLGSISGFDRLAGNGLLSSRTLSSILGASYQDERVWYDQFTSTDWVHDSIADGFRKRELRRRKDIKGRLWVLFDSAQGWILVAVIGCITALFAYFIDVTEATVFDYKDGFCINVWYWSRVKCCNGTHHCENWRAWSQLIHPSGIDSKWIEFAAFIGGCLLLSVASCFLTLHTKTVVPSNTSLLTLDEDLGAVRLLDSDSKDSPIASLSAEPMGSSMTYYSAAGSGVAEVKVILSGFVLHGYLGVRTLLLKSLGLILSVASGLSLGKEGPYVHIATCIGNIACRAFSKYNLNDGKRREVLSAAAAGGVAVAFGAPIGGVLFSLEEVSYFFPPKTLFRTFFSCIAAAMCLKFLNPYGTGKIVLFEVRYVTDWHFFELFAFVFLGVAGGLLGALFIKASRFWAKTFRRVPVIKKWPMLEVVLVALITGVTSFWNRYTRLAVAELLFELASPCNSKSKTGLCKTQEEIPEVIRYLTVAFVIKAFLTTITFGIKVPAGIYVPSMVVGGLMGRIVGHIMQYAVLRYPDFPLFSSCPQSGGVEACITPGVYALVAAGATMCGVTRLSVTLAVILFELTGSLDHVIPFSLAVLCAKWTADAVEPLSIYDLLTDMNSYPFLDNKNHPIFDTELGDLVSRVRRDRVIDIANSPLVRAVDLREKLEILQMAGELDGGLPLVRDKVLVGLIPAPDLEFALDRLENEDTAMCLMATQARWTGLEIGLDNEDSDNFDATDFTPFIDPSPVALDFHSPMDLVYQCFVKLGLRYICVLKEGQFAGLVHKKSFVKYVKELEVEEREKGGA